MFLRNGNTRRQVNTASHLSTEVLEMFCSGPRRLQKMRSTLRAEAIFILGSLLRCVTEENVLILSVLQGVSFIMSRDSCPAQGHVEGHTLLCRTPCLLETLIMLPSVGETPALSAPVSKARVCLMKSVFCKDTQRLFSPRNHLIHAQKSEELIYTAAEA
jgi:hypothetical protein